MDQTATRPEVAADASVRRVRCVLLVVVLLVVAACVLVAGGGYWYYAAGVAQRDAEIARIRARGEPVWFSELAPPPLDPAEDGTALFLQALADLDPPDRFESGLLDCKRRLTQDELEYLRDLVERNRGCIERMARAVEKGRFRYPVNYQSHTPIADESVDLHCIQDVGGILAAEIQLALAEGDIHRACEAVHLSLAMSQLLGDMPLLHQQLLRLGVVSFAMQPFQQLLGYADLTTEQHDRFDRLLHRMVDEFSLQNAMIGERAAAMTSFEYLEEYGEESDRDYWFRFVRHRVQAQTARIMSDIVAFVDVPGAVGDQGMDACMQSLDELPAYLQVCLLFVPVATPIRETGLRHRQLLTNARVALRVDRFRAKHGRLPRSLDELLDETMPEVPRGLLSGQPVVYRAGENEFAVYAVGRNGVDDGGDRQQPPADPRDVPPPEATPLDRQLADQLQEDMRQSDPDLAEALAAPEEEAAAEDFIIDDFEYGTTVRVTYPKDKSGEKSPSQSTPVENAP